MKKLKFSKKISGYFIFNFFIFSLCFYIFLFSPASASAADSGYLSPSTMADDATVGTVSWTSPDNAKISDAAYATVIGPMDGVYSHYLKATNFGFSIPTGATINGILVEISRKSSINNANSYTKDTNLNIVKSNGSYGSTNKADTTTKWPTTEEYKSYGSSSDLWGETWSAEDVNNINFGLVFAIFPTNIIGNTTASVNHIRIKVFYTPSSAPTNQDVVFPTSISKTGGASVSVVSSADATNNIWFAPSGTTVFSAGPTMTTAGGTATSILAPATAGTYKMFVVNSGGTYSAASTATLTVDNTSPTIALTSSAANIINAPFSVTATFSESVSDFVLGDITITNGTASNFSGSGTAYTFTVTPTVSGTVTVDILAGVATDAAGNGNIPASGDTTPPAPAIGDSYQGGKVAYILQAGDPGYLAGQRRGLIAATADQSAGIQWAIPAYQNSTVGATGIAIGTGLANTNAIVSQNGAGTTYAAGLARAYTGGGYTDWYLPSQDEFYKLAVNNVAIGGFSYTGYSTSSETGAGLAYRYHLAMGGGSYSKANGYYVRAVRSFTGLMRTYTTDVTPPTISTLSPTDNATGVVSDANLVITFSEAVFVGTGNITIKKTIDNSVFEIIPVGDARVTGTGTNTITINLAGTFVSGIEYYVLIDSTGFNDLINNYAGISNTTDWSFTGVVDNTPPITSILFPLDNATGVGTNDNLVMTFSEPVKVGTGNITIKKTSDNSVFETIPVSDARVIGTGTNIITINPTGTLASSTEYYVLIDATVFDDLAGNSYVGISSMTDWSFTGIDFIPPTIALTSAAANIINEPFSVTATFSESVSDFVLGDITVTNGTASNFSGSGTTYTFTVTPTTSGAVTVDVLTGVATDAAGNGNIPASGDTTPTAPAIGDSYQGGKVAYILQAGDPGYLAGQRRGLIAAIADQSTGIQWAIPAYQNSTVGATGIAIGTGLANTNAIVSQNGAGTTYAAGLARAYTGGGYTDWYLPSNNEFLKLLLNRVASGLPTTGGYWTSSENSAGYAWRWQIGGGDNNYYPKSNLYYVRAVRSFTGLTRTYALPPAPTNQDTVFATSVSKMGGASVTVVSSGDATNNIWFAPSGTTVFTAGPTMTTAGGTATSILAPATAGTYKMFVVNSGGVSSLASTATLTVDNTAPTVVTLSPLDNATSVASDTNLVIMFSKAVNIGTGNITIKKTSDNSTFETIPVGDARITGTGTGIITINPTGTLSSLTEYYVLIDATCFDDLVGNSYAGISSMTDWSFTGVLIMTSPTGGIITTDGNYTVHTFTNGGTFTPVKAGNVEVLVVAGGGGGAAMTGGGGGAGGLLYDNTHAVAVQPYTVTVGNGGAGQVGSANPGYGSNGSNSIFDNLTAIGGGRGGTNAAGNAGSGGSGGSCGHINCTGGLGTVGQGYDGGSQSTSAPHYGSGGGGGAGHSGYPGTSDEGGGNGGDGLAYSISGSSVYYAGGGGGGSYPNDGRLGTGGLGGGGSAPAGNATPNTGGGGGGQYNNLSNGGNGGSGIVIIRYLTSSQTNTAIITQSSFKLFGNLNSTDVGSGLTSQNTSYNLNYSGQTFRLRMLMGVEGATLPSSGTNFKLQYAQKVGSCDTSFVGENYMDVTSNTEIAYNNNFDVKNGFPIVNNINDPIHSLDIVVAQTYVDSSIFTNNVSSIPAGQYGKWDFSLYNKGISSNISYCLRVVKENGSLLDAYSFIPEVTTAFYQSRGGGGVVNIESSVTPGGTTTGGNNQNGGTAGFTQCSDGIDNDSDGLIDALDPGCHANGNLNEPYIPTHDLESTSQGGGTGGGTNPGGGGTGDLGYLIKLINDIFNFKKITILLATVQGINLN